MNYFKIGKLVATYGLKGEIVLKHSLGKKTSLKDLEAIFIEEKNDSFIPYFIQSSKIKNDAEVYVKFEGIDTKESARTLTPKEAWLTEEDFKNLNISIDVSNDTAQQLLDIPDDHERPKDEDKDPAVVIPWDVIK